MPYALLLAEARAKLGIFTVSGLKMKSEVWDQVGLMGQEGRPDAFALTRQLVKRLILEDLGTPAAARIAR